MRACALWWDSATGDRGSGKQAEEHVPSDAAMQGSALQHAAQVLLCGFLLVRVDEGEEGFTDEEVGLFLEVAGEDGVEVDEAEVGIEEGPVCATCAHAINQKKKKIKRKRGR